MITPNNFNSDSIAAMLNLRNISENSIIHNIIIMLNSSYIDGGQPNENSIMEYGNICKCYDGMICSHRLQYIVDFLKKEELKNKLNSINNEKNK